MNMKKMIEQRIGAPRLRRAGAQPLLLDLPRSLPNGLIYKPDFITQEEEEVLLAYIENLPLKHATLSPREDDRDSEIYTAKRRHLGFGWDFDHENAEFIPGGALPGFLSKLQRRIAKWLDIPEWRVAEALINEYSPGTSIGWHRDREHFETIIGVSLAGWARMRFRPLSKIGERNAVMSVEVEPRSVYIMQGDVRWRWQHSVAPVEALRYSITFRTLPSQVRER
jgi:alkylated DNA repair dioxygenase AlkB